MGSLGDKGTDVVSGENADEEKDDVKTVKKEILVERESCAKDAVDVTSSTRLRNEIDENGYEDNGSECVKTLEIDDPDENDVGLQGRGADQ